MHSYVHGQLRERQMVQSKNKKTHSINAELRRSVIYMIQYNIKQNQGKTLEVCTMEHLLALVIVSFSLTSKECWLCRLRLWQEAERQNSLLQHLLQQQWPQGTLEGGRHVRDSCNTYQRFLFNEAQSRRRNTKMCYYLICAPLEVRARLCSVWQ